jgi:hypothetical protein
MGAKKLATSGFLVAVFVCIGVWSHPAYSQTPAQGNKAVIDSSGGPTPSTIWIDASAWWDESTTTNPDLCNILNTIIALQISGGSTVGVVIDARGLYNSFLTSPAVACTGTPFPTSASSFAMTILLPSATIPMSSTWIVPNNTRLVGEGQNTNLVAESGFTGTGYMIEMGASSLCSAVSGSSVCTSVGIEHLLLSDPHQTGVGGIDNQFSTNSSYVNDVNLDSFNNIGLNLSAPDSGPYSNVTFSSAPAGSPNGPGPTCVYIGAQTLGVHGVTCTGNSTTGIGVPDGGVAGIYVNASNNTIEDIHLEAFWNGIEIGNIASGTVANVLVSNVTGSKSGMGCGTGTKCQVTNIVHVCGPDPANSSDICLAATSLTKTQDVSLFNILGLSGSTDIIASVRDDATATAIVRCAACEQPLSTAIYALGEPYAGGYPRLATNPSSPGTNYDTTSTFVPTWSEGSSSLVGDSCITPGAIYSNTSGGSMTSIFVCTYNGTTYLWKAIA